MRQGFCSPDSGTLRLIRFFAAAGLLAWLMLVLSASVVMAQTTPSPLSPPDTTSPRASFENFLRNTDAFIASRRANAPVNEQNTALRAAVESFDFDATPYAASTSKQIERVLMTREILARAQMPAASSIPDAQAAAANGIVDWTVPGTGLRMMRIDGGRDAGEFKFDARTIVDLELDYHQVQDLPRRDGRADAYAEYLRGSDRTGAMEDTIATRLAGVRMTSPRNTLEAFMANMNAAHEIAMAAQAAHDADPPAITREQAWIEQAKADNHLRQASSVFDLSQVPAVLRRDTGIESALLLKEILDRMPLPRIDTIPNAVDLAGLESDQAYRWRLPGTGIEIERMQTGPDAGNFLFDANSVALLPANYEALKDLPYRAGLAVALEGEASEPDAGAR